MNLSSQFPTVQGYRLHEKLGQGGSASVYRAVRKRDGANVALKVISKSRLSNPNQVRRVKLEVQIHKNLDHPNIVKLLDYFEDKRYVYMVLEYCDRGEMASYIRHKGSLKEIEARGYFWQLINGVKYLQRNRIMHRDLSLGNMLLHSSSCAQRTVKIADFGLAKELNGEWDRNRTMCGTPNFISPESLLGRPQGPHCDIWSLGCVLFAFLCGKPPFEAEDSKSTINKVLKGKFTLPSNISCVAGDLVSKMLKSDPRERICLAEVESHPFLQIDDDNKSQSIKNSIRNSTGSIDSGVQSLSSTEHSSSSLRQGRLISSSSNLKRRNSPISPQSLDSNISFCMNNISIHDVSSLLSTELSTVSSNLSGLSNASSRRSCKRQCIRPSPLNTTRLAPIRQQINSGLTMTIQKDGEFILESDGAADAENDPVDVMRISSDGSQIIVYHCPLLRRHTIHDKPIPLPSTGQGGYMKFQLSNLPQTYWRKYSQASKIVEKIRSKTHKVRLFTDNAKCILMETSPDFQVEFNEGYRLSIENNGQMAKLESNAGAPLMLDWQNLNASCFSKDIQTVLKTAKHYHEQCLDIERYLEQRDCADLRMFPISIGKRGS